MEYLEGEPLLAVLRAGREGKRLDPLSTGRLIADTADLRSWTGVRSEAEHAAFRDRVLESLGAQVARARPSCRPARGLRQTFRPAAEPCSSPAQLPAQ